MRIVRLLLVLCLVLLPAYALAAAKGGTFTVTVKPSVLPDSHSARLWLPYPMSNDDQTVSDMQVSGNYDRSAVYKDPFSGATYLYAEWTRLTAKPFAVMSFHAETRYAKATGLKDMGLPVPAPIAARYLASTEWVPADQYKAQAAKIVAGKRTILAKARAIYDWTVDNTFRDPDVQGCGLAVPGRTLTEMKGGGKCADISAVFVTLCRAAGVPARDVYGLRLASPKSGDVTSAFHCWAEFYLPGTGWVKADPADVRKMMLVHDLKLGDKDTAMWREFFWGGDDLLRVTLEKGARGVLFNPPQQGGLVNYFMYPFAQVDGRTLNCLDAKDFSYTVDFAAD